MTEASSELRLLCFALAEGAVAWSAWRAAGRFGRPGTRGVDAAFVWLLAHYVATGLAGLAGVLSLGGVTAIGVAIAAVLLAVSRGPRRLARLDGWKLTGLAFVVGYVLAVLWQQRYLPPVATDALVYHLPAAAQWMRDGHFGLVPTWFANPANTYSPLGGSVFYAWAMALLGPDAPVHWFAATAVPLIYLAAYGLARRLRASPVAAMLAAAALCVSRPVVDQLDKGKDDLFLLAGFAVAALACTRLGRGDVWRLGVAVGLCLAIKYTALLALPLLLLAVRRKRPRWAGVGVGFACVVLLAGPWYVRNAVLTGNPLFPTRLLGLPALFSTGRSLLLRSPGDVAGVLLAGPYAVPRLWASALAVGWLAFAARRPWRRAGGRLVLFGPAVGLALFLAVSPYPETRFLLPALLLAGVAASASVWTAALSFVAAGLTGLIGLPELLATYLAAGAVAAGLMSAGLRWGDRWTPRVRLSAAAVLLAGVAGAAYVNWNADLGTRRAARAEVWSVYPQAGVWTYLDAQVPPTATLAYTGSSLIYPLFGPDAARRVAYVPVRPGVATPADLPWLGERLAGEQINAAATRATVDGADEAVWLKNLSRLRPQVLVVLADADSGWPIERTWADARPGQFARVYADAAGAVYAVQSTP